MQVLGISGGRRLGNSEILLKESLMGVEEQGGAVEFIRLMDINIKPPSGEDMPRVSGDSAAALSKKMAKADGVVSTIEVDAFRRRFTVPPGEEKHVARLFDLAKADVAGYEGVHCIGSTDLAPDASAVAREPRKHGQLAARFGSRWLRERVEPEVVAL